MEELKRMVDFIDLYGQGPNSLINFKNEETLEGKLFHLLQSGLVKTDREAANFLYGNAEVTTSFRMLKSRFQKKLFNHLHLLKGTVDELSSVNGVEYQCLSLLLEAQALRIIYESKMALKVLHRVFQLASEHAITEMKIKALENMSIIYVNRNDKINYIKVETQLQDFYRVEALEREAKIIFSRIILNTKSTIAVKSKIIKEFPLHIKKLEELWARSHSSKIYNYLHKISILYLEQQGRYSDIVKAVARAEQLVKEERLSKSWYESKYNHYIKIYALLQTREYQEGLNMAAACRDLFEKTDVNWYGFMENYFLLNLHSKEYLKAHRLLIEVLSEAGFSNLPEDAKEHWELYRRYYQLIQTCTAHLPAAASPRVEQFKVLSKDKSGFNLALLVLDLVENLTNARADNLEQQAERVRKYTGKYLKGEKAERPRLFMRMLQLALQEQSLVVVQERGEKLLKKLKVTPLPGDAFAEVEVVPYEHLWALVLRLLAQRQNS